MKKISILAGVAALAVSGTALAQSGHQRGGDRNVDVTRAQAAAKADQAFQRMDLNRDGRVTREEMQQARQQMKAAGQQRRAERMAQLTPEQRAEIEQRRAQRGERAGRGGERRGGEARGQRGQRGGERANAMFGEQGFVTAEQFRARALQRFDRMDLDNDGTVTAEERRQARAQMRERMQQRRANRG